MTDPTHIPYPFRWGPHGNAVEVTQDTIDEIGSCVEVIARTDIGALQDLPEFGINDPTFTRRVDVNQLSRQINQWEPRAQIQITSHIDSVDTLIDTVTLAISTRSQL